MTTTYHTVCSVIGWMPSIHPIRVTRSTSKHVWVTGTALKPDEWYELLSYHGFKLPDDRTLRVTRVPAEVRARLGRWS